MHIKNYIKVFEKRFKKRYEKALKKALVTQQIGRAEHISMSRRSGFTLIEILVVIGIIAVLAAVVLVAINPSRQFKLARDSQRVSNVDSILNAIDQNMAEHGGLFVCGSSTLAIPTSTDPIASPASTTPNGFDIAQCVIPAYISALPFDPSAIGAHYASTSDYDTGYTISQDVDGRITINALGEITRAISVTR